MLKKNQLSDISSNYLNNRAIILILHFFRKQKGLIPCIQVLDELLYCMLSLVSVIMDFIPNHTGKESVWFQRSQRREGKYADYYIWAPCDPFSGTYINNWVILNFSSF